MVLLQLFEVFLAFFIRRFYSESLEPSNPCLPGVAEGEAWAPWTLWNIACSPGTPFLSN